MSETDRERESARAREREREEEEEEEEESSLPRRELARGLEYGADHGVTSKRV